MTTVTYSPRDLRHATLLRMLRQPTRARQIASKAAAGIQRLSLDPSPPAQDAILQTILELALAGSQKIADRIRNTITLATISGEPQQWAIALESAIRANSPHLARLLADMKLAAVLSGAARQADQVLPKTLTPDETQSLDAIVALFKDKPTSLRESVLKTVQPGLKALISNPWLMWQEAGPGGPDEPFVHEARPEAPPPEVVFPMIEEATNKLLSRRAMTRMEFDLLTDQAKASAFTVAGLMTDQAVGAVQGHLAEMVRTGMDKRAFASRLLADGIPLEKAHLENVYRTGVMTAYSDGKDALMNRPGLRELFPYVARYATHDRRVRPEHLAMEKLGIDQSNIYRANDPVIRKFRSPWSWSCRCEDSYLSIMEAAHRGCREAKQWLETGVEPSPPAWVSHPPFDLPEGWTRLGLDVRRLSSTWDESQHPRETTAHDGKNPGEFAPKSASRPPEPPDINASPEERKEAIENALAHAPPAAHGLRTLLDTVGKDLSIPMETVEKTLASLDGMKANEVIATAAALEIYGAKQMGRAKTIAAIKQKILDRRSNAQRARVIYPDDASRLSLDPRSPNLHADHNDLRAHILLAMLQAAKEAVERGDPDSAKQELQALLKMWQNPTALRGAVRLGLIVRLAWTAFTTKHGGIGAVNEVGRRLYGEDARRALESQQRPQTQYDEGEGEQKNWLDQALEGVKVDRDELRNRAGLAEALERPPEPSQRKPITSFDQIEPKHLQEFADQITNLDASTLQAAADRVIGTLKIRPEGAANVRRQAKSMYHGPVPAIQRSPEAEASTQQGKRSVLAGLRRSKAELQNAYKELDDKGTNPQSRAALQQAIEKHADEYQKAQTAWAQHWGDMPAPPLPKGFHEIDQLKHDLAVHAKAMLADGTHVAIYKGQKDGKTVGQVVMTRSDGSKVSKISDESSNKALRNFAADMVRQDQVARAAAQRLPKGPPPIPKPKPAAKPDDDTADMLDTDTEKTPTRPISEAPQAEGKPPEVPKHGRVYSVRTKHLRVDPERFQYKLGTDKSGVTQELKKVTQWRPEFAGVILAWRDPETGEDNVVNGHHRYELAHRLGVAEMDVKYIDAGSAEEARAIGAAANIAEGRGTAIDAAKFMRDQQIDPQQMKASGLSLDGKVAKDAVVLRNLSDPLFNKLATGRLDEQKALAIGRFLGDHDLQETLLRVLDKKEAQGKELHPRVIEEMAREMQLTPKAKKEGDAAGSMFGDFEDEESLFVERAEIKAGVRKALGREVRDFQAVSSERRAERVSEAGNVLDTEKNRQVAVEHQRVLNAFDTLVNSKGHISDAVNEAATEYAKAKTQGERDAAQQRALGAVRDAVYREAGVGQPAGPKPTAETPQADTHPERAAEGSTIPPGGEDRPTEPDAAAAAGTGGREREGSESAGVKNISTSIESLTLQEFADGLDVRTDEPVATTKPISVPFDRIHAVPRQMHQAKERAKKFIRDYQDGADFPPITVIQDRRGGFEVDDGLHRFTAISTDPPKRLDVIVKFDPDTSFKLRGKDGNAIREAFEKLRSGWIYTSGPPAPDPATGIINPKQSGVPGIVSGAVEIEPKPAPAPAPVLPETTPAHDEPAEPEQAASAPQFGVSIKPVTTKKGENRHVHNFRPSEGFWNKWRSGEKPKSVTIYKDPRSRIWSASVWGKTPDEVANNLEDLQESGMFPADVEVRKSQAAVKPKLADDDYHGHLAEMDIGDLSRVHGFMVRRTKPDEWRIETQSGKGNVHGDAEKIVGHIQNEEKLQKLWGRARHEALDRAEAYPEPSWMDADRLERDNRAFQDLKEGTHVISLDDDAGTHGRIGKIVKDGAGNNRVKLDGEDGFASNFVEPLEAKHSWRLPEEQRPRKAEAAKGMFEAADGTETPKSDSPDQVLTMPEAGSVAIRISEFNVGDRIVMPIGDRGELKIGVITKKTPTGKYAGATVKLEDGSGEPAIPFGKNEPRFHRAGKQSSLAQPRLEVVQSSKGGSSAPRLPGNLPLNMITVYPSGKWGFTGQVDGRLLYIKKDGSQPTSDELARISQSSNPSMAADIAGVKTRVFETADEAVAAAQEIGAVPKVMDWLVDRHPELKKYTAPSPAAAPSANPPPPGRALRVRRAVPSTSAQVHGQEVFEKTGHWPHRLTVVQFQETVDPKNSRWRVGYDDGALHREWVQAGLIHDLDTIPNEVLADYASSEAAAMNELRVRREAGVHVPINVIEKSGEPAAKPATITANEEAWNEPTPTVSHDDDSIDDELESGSAEDQRRGDVRRPEQLGEPARQPSAPVVPGSGEGTGSDARLPVVPDRADVPSDGDGTPADVREGDRPVRGGRTGARRTTAKASGRRGSPGAVGEGSGARPDVGGDAADAGNAEPAASVADVEPAPISTAGNWQYKSRDVVKGGLKSKFRTNLDAIVTLKNIQMEGRTTATPEEQEVLSKYVGWGQFPAIFNTYKEDPATYEERAELKKTLSEEEYGARFDYQGWQKEQQQLKALLTADEWKAAKGSTLNAHYTHPDVVAAHWKMAKQLGFTGGRFLETSAGIGYYLGMMPPELAARTSSSAVELDKITGAMLALLYPQAKVKVQGFEKFQAPDGFYDLVASNVPFGAYKVHDPDYNKFNANIHDYFFLKSLDKVRPGGLVMHITSTGTMDKPDSKIRAELAKSADLVAAIRFPGGAHKENAGTEVVTDLIILRKRDTNEPPAGPSWIDVTTVPDPAGGEPIPVNRYFADNPEQILGTLDRTGTMYRGESVNVSKTDDYQKRLDAAIARLPAGIMKPAAATKAAFRSESLPAPGDVKNGGFTIQDGKLYRREGGAIVAQDAGKTLFTRIAGQLEIRDAIRETINAQIAGESADKPRAKLNRLYDAFVKKHGYLHDRGNTLAMRGDPDAPVLLALEKWDAKAKKATKADMFSKDTVRAVAPVEKVETVAEGLSVCLHESGMIDVERIATLMNKSLAAIESELRATGIAYEDPTEGWKPADQYLSGNVRRKLVLAQAAAEVDAKYKANVEALERVQPDDVPYDQIGVKLGATWVPGSDIADFAAHLCETTPDAFNCNYVSADTGEWHVAYSDSREGWKAKGSKQANEVWGTEDRNLVSLLDAAMNGRPIVVRIPDPNDSDKKIVDKKATEDAMAKAGAIKDAFREWIWEDDARRERLHRYYNDHFNNIRHIKYNGSHQRFPGANPAIELRDHQKDFVWQVVTTGKGLAAHEVGTGKTFSMIAAAMELRRLGLARKPAIACLKANVESITQDALKLYPGAKILSTVDMFDAKNRKRTISQIATGDYDMIILTHDQLDLLSMTPETIQKYLEEETAELEAAIEAAKADKNKTITKQLEKALKNLTAKLEGAIGAEKKDDAIYFEESGIDALFVDEAHRYKSLPAHTKQRGLKGIPTSRSDRATTMLMRTRWLMEKNNGRGVVFATGTPVTNTMAELFNMQRYLQPEELKERGIDRFDAWASLFGDINTKMEFTVSGELKPVSRFAKFVNIPELMQLARQIMDVQRVDTMLKKGEEAPVIDRPKKREHVVAAPKTAEMEKLMRNLKARAEAVKANPYDRTDNMLAICTDGRKGAADMRLVNPYAAEEPDSKTNLCVRNVLRIHNERPTVTQLIFTNIGVHKSKVTGFHLYQEIIDRLVEGGIPREKIANFAELKGAQKEEAMEAMRRGDILVAIGSTEKLGTGVNVQNKLAALHHLDVPWFPADLEQRDGRAWRQGNENKEIDIYKYVTEGSLDQTFWQIIANKTAFIRQVMLAGGNASRVAEELDTTELKPEVVSAIASGDPRILDLANLNEEVKTLKAAADRHRREQERFKQSLRNSERALPNAIQRAAESKGDLERLEAIPEFSLVLDGIEYSKRTDAGEALQQKSAAIEAKAPSYGGYEAQTFHVANVGTFRGMVISRAGTGYYLNSSVSDQRYPITALTVQSLDAAARKVATYAAEDAAEVEKIRKEIATIKDSLGKPFKLAEMLVEKAARAKELEAAIAADREKKSKQPDDEGEFVTEIDDDEMPTDEEE